MTEVLHVERLFISHCHSHVLLVLDRIDHRLGSKSSTSGKKIHLITAVNATKSPNSKIEFIVFFNYKLFTYCLAFCSAVI